MLRTKKKPNSKVNTSLNQTGDEEAKAVRNDVLKIVRGPGLGHGCNGNIYLVSALSDLRRTLKMSAKTGPKNQMKLAVKKIEFYLAWTNMFYDELFRQQ